MTSQWLSLLLPSWRQVSRVVLVLPAVVAAFCILGMSLLLIASDSQSTQWRRRALWKSVVEHKDAISILHYSVLLERDPDNQELEYGLALCQARMGRVHAAMAILNRLTPETHLGYPPAHIAAAELVVTSPVATADQLGVARRHLQRVLASQPQNAKAQELLGLVYCRTGQWLKVQEPAEQRWKRLDPWSGQLARELAHGGDKAGALVWAKHCVDYCNIAIPKDLGNPRLRMDQAESLLLLGEYADAVRVLVQGWNGAHLDAYHHAIGVAFMLWLKNEPSLLKGPGLGLMEEALKADPQHGPLLAMVLSHLDEAAGLDRSESLFPATRATTSPAEGAALRSLCRAAVHARRMDSVGVRAELGQSLLGSGEAMVPVTASLACVWASGDHGDPAGALWLLRTLQELRPDAQVVWRAQAVVFMQQRRWNEAATALEKCLAVAPADRWVNESLAQVHESLDRSTKASVNRTAPTTAHAN